MLKVYFTTDYLNKEGSKDPSLHNGGVVHEYLADIDKYRVRVNKHNVYVEEKFLSTKNTNFLKWLEKFKKHESPIGDLARNMVDYKNDPNDDEKIINYCLCKYPLNSVSSWAIEVALEEARERFKNE